MYFVFDLDGTICFKGQPVSQKILKSIGQLKGMEHEVIFASARPIRDMLPVIDKSFHDYTMIGGNGSLIYKKGKSVLTRGFEKDQLIKIKTFIHQYKATYLIDGTWDYAYTGPLDHPILNNLDPEGLANRVALEILDPVVKVLVLTATDLDALATHLEALDVVVHRHQNEQVIDISPPDIDKWQALQTLGIKKGEYIAFGNDANDVTLLENAAHAVMIGDHAQLAEIANEKIPLERNIEQLICATMLQLAERWRSSVKSMR
ncbi:Cof subfamily protein (haloacid dehalogenase superfamily) [Pullulanibacillus pueri]|uniref:Hydrolase n=1 Tax=Pullulanibacillus pueri TaxID=1437324 RepID=A0A8J3ENV7_9BACL|nr:HAD-IIB family hydrolase [Pullulanibacillus pueri]MBM7683763.1 Cof subfamily protein (haloacid dehalogenase superfamily) [Pullulanibacillus pueri]GGH87314.1 hydrolase [Pullulanibacillus pueri]